MCSKQPVLVLAHTDHLTHHLLSHYYRMVITIAIIIIILSYVGLGVHTLIIYMCLPRDSCGYVVTFHGVYFTKISFPLLWVYTYRSNQVLSLLLRGVH